MRWRRGRRSANVEDRRGTKRGGMRVPTGGRKGGIGGIGLIIVLVGAWYFGIDPSIFLQGTSERTTTTQTTATNRADDEAKAFVSTILAYTEDAWSAQFKKMERTYKAPKLVLFSGRVQSACGLGQAARWDRSIARATRRSIST